MALPGGFPLASSLPALGPGRARYRCPMDDDDAPYRRDYRPEFRGSDLRRSGRDPEPLDQRLDRWVSAGRQFVDGVAGSRPGSRPPARGPEGRGGGRGGFDGLGRWVEERLDWLLEDGDDWREPWQENGPRPQSQPTKRSLAVNPPNPSQARSSNPSNPATPPGIAPRRRLEALSRRGLAPQPPASPAPDGDAWPEDESFSLPRWQRPNSPGLGSEPPAAPEAPEGSGRPLPRSTRSGRRP
jgi:hypothetical protein